MAHLAEIFSALRLADLRRGSPALSGPGSPASSDSFGWRETPPCACSWDSFSGLRAGLVCFASNAALGALGGCDQV